MIVPKMIVLIWCGLMASSSVVDAFGVSLPTTTSTTTITSMMHGFRSYGSPIRSSRLFMEDPSSASGDETNSETVESGEAASAAPEMDILNSPAFLKRKIEVLKSDIQATEKEAGEARALAEAGKAEWGPQLDALRSEYKNIQERMSTQTQTRDKEVVRQVVREMLGLLDNFDRAFGIVKATTEEEKVCEEEYREAYQMVMDVIKGLGVEEVQTVGTEFDYELHQAVMQKPGTEYEEGTVCEEFQKGFKIGDSLIRPAMVAVAA